MKTSQAENKENEPVAQLEGADNVTQASRYDKNGGEARPFAGERGILEFDLRVSVQSSISMPRVSQRDL